MEIKLSDTQKIKTDKFQYIYCIKKKPSKNCPDGFYPKWYYPTLSQCYNDLLEEFTREGDKKTLKENVEEAVKLLESLRVPIK